MPPEASIFDTGFEGEKMEQDILKQAVTPAYVFAADEAVRRVRFIKDTLGSRIRVLYAVKANPFLVEALIPEVDGFEVCSPGEERICRSLRVPAEKMVLSGVYKDPVEYTEIVGHYGDKALYTVESVQQMDLLNSAARAAGCVIPVLLRLSSGNQFGMDEETIRRLKSEAGMYPGVRVTGLQYFSGTQKRFRKILLETERLAEVFDRIEETAGSLDAFEFGPGLPVTYFQSEADPDDEGMLMKLRGALEETQKNRSLSLEIGRFIAAYCGRYLTRAVDLKQTSGARYCIVDGGIHQINYYGQMMGMKLPYVTVLSEDEAGAAGSACGQASDGPDNGAGDGCGTEETAWMVCGALCTTADVLVRELPLRGLKTGDVLVFERTGAYSVTEGISLFLSRDLPRVYLADRGKLIEVRERVLTENWNGKASVPLSP